MKIQKNEGNASHRVLVQWELRTSPKTHKFIYRKLDSYGSGRLNLLHSLLFNRQMFPMTDLMKTAKFEFLSLKALEKLSRLP